MTGEELYRFLADVCSANHVLAVSWHYVPPDMRQCYEMAAVQIQHALMGGPPATNGLFSGPQGASTVNASPLDGTITPTSVKEALVEMDDEERQQIYEFLHNSLGHRIR